ncbi:RES family NAD+ phosphorylase [Paenibacillus donghaensis]|uniref:RES domain-containing protein n=1 Tax=Paenibacillus donghaensis TaxID=414771 RepID=A0A2Z2K6Y9_9BACL|nr:RES family NAD+ phosphorylase [Paenibacillus donghaensis]ASA22066.1 hypothetical protein B9T62_15555 [Paenibacillus donghaensis]
MSMILYKGKQYGGQIGEESLGASILISNNKYAQDEYDKFADGFKLTNKLEINSQENIFNFIRSIGVEKIYPDEIFYRGRKGRLFRKLAEVKAPPHRKAGVGRLNPKGVSFLYAADSISTALLELNASIFAPVTIVECRPKRMLKLLNLVHGENEDAKINSFRKIIDLNFSRPVSSERSLVEYMPTQAIAQYIRDYMKLDGVKYTCSKNSNQFNIVIFNGDLLNYKLDKSIHRLEDQKKGRSIGMKNR